MRPAAKVVGIAIVIVVIVIGLVAYSYTQIQINLVDISYAGIDWAPKSLSTFLKLAVNLLTGNILEAALSLIAGIKLNLIFALTNHGFFPVYIPNLSYDLLVNDVNVGHGTSKVDTTIYPGEEVGQIYWSGIVRIDDSFDNYVSNVEEFGDSKRLTISDVECHHRGIGFVWSEIKDISGGGTNNPITIWIDGKEIQQYMKCTALGTVRKIEKTRGLVFKEKYYKNYFS